jgi:Ser/Thr protein kinase RdoA (MazF antagonist)
VNHKGKSVTALEAVDPSGVETPFGQLMPEAVMDAIEAVGPRCDGRLMALNSFENRVYQIGIEDGGVERSSDSFLMAKFYRPGRWSDETIQEEHDFLAELVAGEIPAVPPIVLNGTTLHHHGAHRFALFERRGGRAPELDDDRVLERIGRFMGRLHRVGSSRSFKSRESVDIETFGDRPLAWLAQSNWIPPELKAAWAAVTQLAMAGVRRAFERAQGIELIRLHGDCHAGNILWTDAGPHFVDFDDSRTGPAIQDLWMLLSGDGTSQSRQLTQVLKGYQTFGRFALRELHMIEALRTLRYVHYTAWIARRWEDPAFPAAFPWFGAVRDWQDRILALREQVGAMEEPRLEPLMD